MQVYNVSVGVAWRTAPSGSGYYVGGLSITFTCDPASSARLVDMALSEFEHLQVHLPLPLFLSTGQLSIIFDRICRI